MKTLLFCLAVSVTSTGVVSGRGPISGEVLSEQAVTADDTTSCYSEHRVGRLVMPVGNHGSFGAGYALPHMRGWDCFGYQRVRGKCIFPKGSDHQYLYMGRLVIGAIRGRDTVFSWYYSPPNTLRGDMEMRSTVDPTRPWYEGAISHFDLIATYSDTGWPAAVGVEVTQRSYSWANDYAGDFILFDYSVKNITDERLRQMYIGIYVDADVRWDNELEGGSARDDQAGFLEYYPSQYLNENCPPDSDLLYLGWTADDDSDPEQPYPEARVRDVTGARFIYAPVRPFKVSFNWWNPYYGPELRSNYRPYDGGWAHYSEYSWPPEYWYHILSNGERDYDQIYQGIKNYFDGTWVQPTPEIRALIADSSDPRYLLSVGPVGLDPNQSLHFTTAYIAGQDFHRHAHIDEYLPHDPYGWYERVYFQQLAQNAVWADWIYDNPGFDTDSDGYAGEFVICDLGDDSTVVCDTLTDTTAEPDTTWIECRWVREVIDTIWRKGDGVPDFRAASPPPNPSTHKFVNKYGDTMPGLRVFPEVGKIRVVWNGAVTENTPDWASHKYDFEGYGVYIALDNRPTSFQLVTTYDHHNYSWWEYDYNERDFTCTRPPYTLEQIQCHLGDSCGDTTFIPELYTRSNPYIIPGGAKVNDRVIYFEPCGYNRSIMANDPLNCNSGIAKVYPNAPKPPHVHPDSINIYYPDRDDTTYFTDDGYMKYYEYEYVFDGVLPTIPYYVNVTAFDYGYPGLGLAGLESDPAVEPKAVYALPSSDVIADRNLEAFAYPNPYRLDADYRGRDYEARLRWHLPENKTRAIHFANLPPKCTIRIFSPDGDLIRELRHDVDPDNYLANHETWDMITRNSQMIVSGWYYWTVEDDRGNVQIGKLVVIM